ncbi:MAG: ABC transporter substrate-binding protein [Rhizobiales bacterium]|nr:ABC transporter substrate-binding protein [Hyphomicrobiales bacterium]
MARILTAIAFFLAAIAAPVNAGAQTTLQIIQPMARSMFIWPIHVGEMLGFFEEEGVTLEIISSDANIPYTLFLAGGNADLVMMDSAQTLHAHNAGFDVVSVYEVHRPIPQGIYVKESSPYYSVLDLKGATVGLGSNRDLPTLQVALAHEQSTIDGIDTVVVGDAGPILNSVFTKDFADAFAGSLTSVVPLAAHGVRVRDVTPKTVKSAPINSYVTLKSRVEELRAPLCGFFRAWSKSVFIGSRDIEIIAAMSRHPSGVPEQWENPDYGYQFLHGIADLVIPKGDGFGNADSQAWQAVLDDMLLINELEIQYDVEAIVDRSFQSCANEFNRDQVMAKAWAWMRDPQNAQYVRQQF